MSFLAKILGRNQDFAKGFAWGGLTFQDDIGAMSFGLELDFSVLPKGKCDFQSKNIMIL